MCWDSLCIHLSPQATTSSLHQLWMLNVHWRYTSSHRRGSESAVAPVQCSPCPGATTQAAVLHPPVLDHRHQIEPCMAHAVVAVR